MAYDDYDEDEDFTDILPNLVTVYDPNQMGQVAIAEGDLSTIEATLPDGRYPAFAEDYGVQGTLIIEAGMAVFEPI